MTNLVPRIEFLLQAVFRRRRDCPHCGWERTDLLARKHVVVRVRRCPQCALCFTDPVYDRSVLGVLYDKVYGAEGSTTAMPAPDELGELKRTSFAGTDKDAHDRLKRLRALAGGERLLEVGSSWGYFLFQAASEGFNPTGVEISDTRREFGRRELGVDVRASLDELGDERFDVVYTAHTLEHFTDFRGVLERLHGLLKPGGLLAVEVPHFDHHLPGERALSAVGAVHPLGFTTEFFRRNLPRAGFEVRSFHDAWEGVPDETVAECGGDVVIVLATRPAEARKAAA